MIALLRPTVLFLHEQSHARILDVPDCRVHVLDEVLGSFPCLAILSVETIILDKWPFTYLRMTLSKGRGLFIVGVLFIL